MQLLKMNRKKAEVVKKKIVIKTDADFRMNRIKPDAETNVSRHHGGPIKHHL